MPTNKAPHAELEYKLQKSHTLFDIERMIHDVSISNAKTVDFWLARDLGPQLFKDARIVSLLATAASRGMHPRVIDWIAAPNDEYVRERFGRTLEGIACLEYAHEIVNAKKEHIGEHLHHLRRAVIEKSGIKSPERTMGKSLTFCAFDPDEPTPVEFTSMVGKREFIARFSGYRRDCFEKGVGEGFSDRVPAAADHEIGSFAYEIWHNTFQHGRLDEVGGDIKGMRFVRVQKHIDYDKNAFIDRASGFFELQTYLDREIPESGTFKFYEVTIADNGLGILKRFLATRPEFRGIVADGASRFVNKIIDEALSSKRTQSGAGHGLERALLAVRQLRGFVSLRTGTEWLHYTSAQEPTTKQRLLEVQNTPTLGCVGTQFNLIFPLVTNSKS